MPATTHAVHRQGEFDGACGFYAIVNAVRHLWPRADGQNLFDNVAHDLVTRNRLKSLLYGCDRGALNDSLGVAENWCLDNDCPTTIRRPYWRGAAKSLADSRRKIVDHFDEHGEGAAAIIGYEFAQSNSDESYSHWTVACNVTPKILKIKDSDMPQKQISFSRCRIWDTLSYHKRRPFAIDTGATFLLHRKGS